MTETRTLYKSDMRPEFEPFSIQPPAVKGRRPRFYYATQAAIEPPTFVLFAADAKSVHFSYQRFLENRVRDAFDFEGTPIRILYRGKRDDGDGRRRGR